MQARREADALRSLGEGGLSVHDPTISPVAANVPRFKASKQLKDAIN